MIKEEKKAENPFAFPVTDSSTFVNDGMTLRDYFAAKAMGGLMSMENKGSYDSIELAWEKISKYSYDMADAMLKQREL